jgi:HD superfamily phosphohydrolase
LDLDRLDYLMRDSHGTGVPYGRVDINYLLNHLMVSQEGIVGVSSKALAAAEHLLLARFFMHRVVYYHKTIYGMEEACRQLLRRLRDRDDKKYNIPVDGDAVRKLVASDQLGTFTDAFVDGIVQKAIGDSDSVVGVLARAIQSRKPPKLLKEVQICNEKETEFHAGTLFKSNCRNKLQAIAEEFHIPLGQFILCDTQPLTVGDRPEELTASEAAKL